MQMTSTMPLRQQMWCSTQSLVSLPLSSCPTTSPSTRIYSPSLPHLPSLRPLPRSGFSFKGPPRPPFASALETLRHESRLEFVDRVTRPPVVSVDVPSGWPVDEDTSSSPPTPELTFHPDVLISLTAPKTGVRRFQRTTGQRGGGGQVQRHFLGGRFVPPRVARKFGLKGMLQGGFDFRRAGDSQIVEVTNWREAEDGEETEDSEYEEYDEEEGEGEEQHEGRR